jgi:hypothetical protein
MMSIIKRRHNRFVPLYKRRVFEYIGKGFIHSIGGIKQSFTPQDVAHFWKYTASNTASSRLFSRWRSLPAIVNKILGELPA